MCCNKGFQTVGAEGGEEETAEDVNQIIEILKYFKPLEQQNVFKLSHLRIFTVRSEDADMIRTC